MIVTKGLNSTKDNKGLNIYMYVHQNRKNNYLHVSVCNLHAIDVDVASVRLTFYKLRLLFYLRNYMYIT